MRVGCHRAACRHLKAADPILRMLIDRIGQCELTPMRGAFSILCRYIISQQLSIAAAATIYDRFTRLYPYQRPTPEAVLSSSAQDLLRRWIVEFQSTFHMRSCPRIPRGRIRPRLFARQTNEEIMAALMPIQEIGRWTVEMF